jgi:phosphatidylglycerol:prolipoprotein diacylglycerol transferase
MHILQATLPYPDINPVLLPIWGPTVGIRWYALSYIAGLLVGWWLVARTVREAGLWKNPPFNGKAPATADEIGDLIVWATLGTILGGRIGWLLFYGTFYCGFFGAGQDWCAGLPMDFLHHPLRLIEIWKGGMSFHGGFIGVALAVYLFCRRRKLDVIKVGDLVATATPIGLFFGRIANFINGELPGRITNVPWAMRFCGTHIEAIYGRGYCPWGPEPRHPSQLYEAFLEGIVLLTLLQICLRVFRLHEKPGLLTGIFIAGYGFARFFVELFRDSESKFSEWFTMGMALSIPMWLAAAFFFWYALSNHGARKAA